LEEYGLVQDKCDPETTVVVDLGCGDGVLTARYSDKVKHVDAVDVASNALKRVKGDNRKNIQLLQDCLPHTKLKDDFYDIVNSTEVIAFLAEKDYRPYFAELSLLAKCAGLVCSSPIDYNSEDALQRFVELAKTEFKDMHWTFSYHAYHIRLYDFFEAPWRFVEVKGDPEYFQKALSKRYALNRWWFDWNSTAIRGALWSPISYLCSPLVRKMKQIKSLMLRLEKICQFIAPQSGITHVIFRGQRKPAYEELRPEQQPSAGKQKREVWE